MLIDTTHHNSEHKQIISDLVGKPYSLVQKLKLRGVGSKRMIIDEVSPNLQQVLNTVSDINYGNIELRPKGILVHITKGLKNFTWIIPYYHLVIYKINGSSIHAQGKFVHFRANKTFKENKKFFDKLVDQKTKHDMLYKIPQSLWI
ncbi:MAG: hypothetical protein CMC76_10975 [Flavobacteriaceae bacterium]|jgi:hypothetical protein|uniref:hypothetical protein n=1 Tax=Winogradskyella poriferorum TaxID=307627 RepID=UPI000C42BDC9|nr:hypothetical protein [Flavobacteriaceae bacterium]MAX71599.1 hypothetical protein [Flavobacteriaceae bacterium]|tara:strand:+ start:112 stop:549 length:438 start_codon:yes stop_codon:yes gene_type:complete